MGLVRVLGLMTGTSCDGVDGACIELTQQGFRLLWTASAPYPPKLRNQVLELQKAGVRVALDALLELDRAIGEWLGRTSSTWIAEHATQGKVDAVALHGQTVAHRPGARGGGKTLQLGDASRVAVATGLTVVCQFREGDLAAGGQGAPLVPAFHASVARTRLASPEGTSIHNLGGISNFTYLGPPGSAVLAGDTGPGNCWTDHATEQATRGKKRFDAGGKLAASAEPSLPAVKKLLAHPYFRMPFPKSTGRDDFTGADFDRRVGRVRGAARVSTALEATARSIAQMYDRAILALGLPLHRIYFCGGGARNLELLRRIQNLLPQVEVQTTQALGLDPHAVEAEAFAFYGAKALLGEPITGPWTGVKDFAPPAHLIPGRNWKDLLAQIRTLQTQAPA